MFSLGCVLYEITTGKKPFDAETDALSCTRSSAVRRSVRARFVAGYPAELEHIVARAMAKDPKDRFASAEGLRIALERWLAKSGAAASERDVAVLVHDRCHEEIEQRHARIRAHGERGKVGGGPSEDVASVRKVDPFAATRFDAPPARGRLSTSRSASS